MSYVWEMKENKSYGISTRRSEHLSNSTRSNVSAAVTWQ